MIEKIKYMTAKLLQSRKICLVGLALLMSAVITFISLSLNSVTVNDGVSVQTFYTLKANTADLLNLAELNSDQYEVTNVTSRGRKINISLSYTFPVYITVGQDTKTVLIKNGTTVNDAVNAAGITLDEHDIVNLALDEVLTKTSYIDIIDVSYVTETQTEVLPYSTKTVYNSNSTKTVTTGGVEGSVKITYLKKYENGVETESQIVSEEVITPAVDKTVTVGTKKATTTSASVNCISTLKPSSPIELDANGNPVNYTKHVTVQATAYTYTGNNCASGMAPQPGCVAVNTNIFPFGTKFYIKSSDGQYIYGYAVAADTGGFLATRPTNFDLFFETEEQCRQFGRRNIEVYVLN